MKKIIKVLSTILAFTMLFTVVGCKNGEAGKQKGEQVIASVMKEVNGRQVVYHNDEPFFFNAVHFRYDYLVRYVGGTAADKALVDGMRLIKENGYETVIIYVPWSDIYKNGEYNLTYFTKQFKEAEKNDLKVLINWFGSNVCGWGGFQSWQTDREKYPALKDAAGNYVLGTGPAAGKQIPDYSAEIYAKEEGEALQRICDWLYENDKDHRTVALQITDEPNNHEGGNGQWMSQFTNYANFMDKLGSVVKNSNYSMVTYTVLMSSGYNDTLEGYNFDQRIRYLIDLPNLDFVGYSVYSTDTTPKFKPIEQDGNMPTFIGLNPASWCTAIQALYSISNGYGYCHYQFIAHNGTDGGYYSVDGDKVGDTLFGVRDGTQLLKNGEFVGELEVDHKEIVNMNTSIFKMDELLATNTKKNIAVLNGKVSNDFEGKKTIDGEKVYMTYKNPDKKYGGCGLMLKADDGNFYGFTTLDASFTFTSDITVTEGYYENGKWVSEKEVEVKNKTFKTESGKTYQIILK